MPKWVNETRQDYLIELFHSSHGFCVFGHEKCQFEKHHYINYIDDLVKDWIQIDRINANANYKAEYDTRHKLRDRLPLHGQFSGIAKDIFFDNQPMYEIEAIGISASNYHPIAKIRLASSNTRIYVDLCESLSGLSKNKKRKLLRYANGKNFDNRIDTACYKAVKHYLSK